MPMTMQVEGLDDLMTRLKKLGDNAGRAAASGLYSGAGVMADEIKGAAGKIRTAPFHYAVFIQREVSPEEKAVVQKGIGISRFDFTGDGLNTSVGYGRASGYAMMAGRRKPIPQIANAINSGTSFMRKQPYVREAAVAGSGKATEAIVKKIEGKINEMTGGTSA